jgi:uncharacterized membrane protein
MPQGDKPRSEPEIIPPGDAARDFHRTRVFVETHDAERIYATRLGPFGFILVVLITGLLLAVLIALLLATLLIWLPLLVLFVAGTIAVKVLRTYFTKAQ